MSRTSKASSSRILLAGVVVTLGVAAYFLLNDNAAEPDATPLSDTRDGVDEAPPAASATLGDSTSTGPSLQTSNEPEFSVPAAGGEVRMAPGPAPWASGLDLPPPEIPDEPPEPDLELEAYLQEQAEAELTVGATTAYLDNSLAMLDETILVLELDLRAYEVAGDTDNAARVRTRLERINAVRAGRQAELTELESLPPDVIIPGPELLPPDQHEHGGGMMGVPPPGVSVDVTP